MAVIINIVTTTIFVLIIAIATIAVALQVG